MAMRRGLGMVAAALLLGSGMASARDLAADAPYPSAAPEQPAAKTPSKAPSKTHHAPKPQACSISTARLAVAPRKQLPAI